MVEPAAPGRRLRSRAATAGTIALIVIAAVALGPMLIEIVSAFHGDHLFTLETLELFVVPLVSLVAALVLLGVARKTDRARVARASVGVGTAVAIAGCLPVVWVITALFIEALRH